jgi:hypothetical protein
MALTLENYGRPMCKVVGSNGSLLGEVHCVTNQKEIEDNNIRTSQSFTIPRNKGKLQHIPDNNKEREILYITAPSGSGKSYYTAQYLKEYKRLYPKRSIYVISSLKEDKTLDNEIKNLKRLKLDSSLYTNPIPVVAFKDFCVVADDVDVISDKRIREAVLSLVN